MKMNQWVHPRTGQVRRYVQGWYEAAGFEIDYYKTGNVSSAAYKGEGLSNRRATFLQCVKVWVNDQNEVIVEGVPDALLRVGVSAQTIAEDVAKGLAEEGLL